MYALAILVRIVLLLFGEWQDRNWAVRYTDVDYKVYSDAALFVSQGASPYDRTTYRYTPILAWMMLPNVLLFPACGKLFFLAADVTVGVLVGRVLERLGLDDAEREWWVCTWLFNPLAINMCTRGSADSVVGVLVLGTLWLVISQRTVAAAAVYGLAVHFRIYPAIYALALFIFLGRQRAPNSGFILGIFSRRQAALRRQLIFAVVSAATFFGTSAAMHRMYGRPFLEEAFLHHLRRADTRHNFSVYFYDLYLRQAATDGGDVGGGESSTRSIVRFLSFAPQASAIVAISLGLMARSSAAGRKNTRSPSRGSSAPRGSPRALARARCVKEDLGVSLCHCCLCLTIAFVAFNKVCTAQYFLWYALLLPVSLPFSALSLKNVDGAAVAAIWLLAEWNWLFWAYQLEFQGRSTFLQVWMAGLVFFAAQLYALISLIRNHRGRQGA
jgi:phosphatidylinositol glycan class M